jgi:hypothetical protein
MDIGAEPNNLLFGAVHYFELERRAGVVAPDFDRIDAVPVRAFAARQQEINRRGGGAAVNDTRIAERLAIMPALGVRRARARG